MAGKRDEEARDEFLAEAQELIEKLSRDLLILDDGLRRSQRSPEILNDLFRGVHTLKGLSGMFGFESLARLSHTLEDLLDELRLGRIEMSQGVLDVLFEGVEGFARLLNDEKTRNPTPSVDLTSIGERVKLLARAQEATHNVIEDYEFEASMLGVLTEYEEHRLKSALEHGSVVYRLRVRLSLDTIDTALDQIKSSVKDRAEIITYLPSMESGGGDAIEIEMLIATALSEGELRTALARPDGALSPVRRKVQPSSKPAAIGGGAVSAPAPLAAMVTSIRAQAIESEAGSGLSLRSLTNVVRVDIRKLDHLMHLVGELGTVRAGMARLVDKLRNSVDPAVSREAQRIARLFTRHLAEMRQSVLGIRMVPLSQLFDKLAVIVRQVARDQNKSARLLITGGDTEVDKLIAEELADPMMHIVRNAIDHGVESLEERQASGKPSTATLAINAYQKGNHVVIELSDDGRGIDTDRVREAAVRKGLLTEQAISDLSRDELLDVVFLPGFSTASAVTDLSGRGVGMDVVKTNITRLGGAVDLESELGVGTKITITLPITLAIINALLFEVRGRLLALPIAVVQEALRIPRGGVRTIEGREVMTLRGATLPLCRLAELFRFSARTPDEAKEHGSDLFVIVIGVGNRKLGLCVDRLAGQQDVVIKGLGRSLSRVSGISGATDLGDQRLVLVLDAASIIDEMLIGKVAHATIGGAS